MFNFFRKRIALKPTTPSPDESDLNKIDIKLDDDDVIFSGTVDSYSDSEDTRLAQSKKIQNDVELAKFY